MITIIFIEQFTIIIIVAFFVQMNNCYSSVFISRLSSVDGIFFRNSLLKILGNISPHSSLVYVPTASYAFNKSSQKTRGEQRRRARYDAKQKCDILMSLLDTKNCKILELDDKDINEAGIQNILKDCKYLYVDGGNTFYLQLMLKRTNFWSIADKFLTKECIYIGVSAGAIVAGRSISTAFWKGWDDPDVTPGIDWNDELCRGRELCPYSIFPHYDSDLHETLVKEKKSFRDISSSSSDYKRY